MSSSSNSELSLSPKTIADNNDVLTEILLRLPTKSILRFKSVSKHWLHLITDPQFCRLKTRKLNNVISALFFQRHPSPHPTYDFVPLHENTTSTAPFKALNFVEDEAGIKILQSCNGLLLCTSYRVENGKCNYYIYNPTNNEFATLPSTTQSGFTCKVESISVVNLAFDPRHSDRYKVICIYSSISVVNHFEIIIYSSETGLWKRCGDPFPASFSFFNGVYWNGAIHWITFSGRGGYFKIDEERFEILPMLPLPDDWERKTKTRFLGESHDHLYHVNVYGPNTLQFYVYEMERDYSGWFVKYHVDLEGVRDAFPEMMSLNFHPVDLHFYNFYILEVIQGNEENDSVLVLGIPGKAISYNLVDGSFTTLYEFTPDIIRGRPSPPIFYECYHYIESFSPIC